jgi:dihydrofolate reductase
MILGARDRLTIIAEREESAVRELVVNTFLTMDGVMQAPGGPEEDPDEGFEHGGWSVNYWDDSMGARMGEIMGKRFDLLLGRKTYEIFAAHWPKVTDDPAGDALNGARKYVASRTLETVDWQNSTLLEGDVVEAVAKLKTESGPEIQVHGSGNLIQTLMKHDLVDRYNLMVFPVVLGTGKRLFADGAVPKGMRLVQATPTSTGVVIGTYEPAGAIDYGTFALED